MTAAAPLMASLMIDVGGFAEPVDPTFGMVPLIESMVSISDAARVDLFDEAFERIGQAWQACRLDPEAPLPSPETVFNEARRNAVAPIADADASARAGREAGRAAAAEYMAQHTGTTGAAKRTDPDAPADGSAAALAKAAATKTRNEKRSERRKLLKQVKDGGVTKAAPGGGAPAAAAADKAAADGKPTLHAAIVAADVGPNSVSVLLDKGGGGLVEILDRLHLGEAPSSALGELPCGWKAALGSHRVKPGGKACNKCAHGAEASATVLTAAKGGCTSELLAKLPADSPVANAP
jgi:hypothetical protein